MMIACDGIIEGIHADIKNAEVRILVLEEDLIYRTWLICSREILWCYEMILVEISLACAEKVKKHYQDDSCRHCGHLELRLPVSN